MLRVDKIVKAILQRLPKITRQGRFQTQITDHAEYQIVHHHLNPNIAKAREGSNVTTAHKLQAVEKSAAKVALLQTHISTLTVFLRIFLIENTIEASIMNVYSSDFSQNVTVEAALELAQGILTIWLDIRRFLLRQKTNVLLGTMLTLIRDICMARCILRSDLDCRFRQELL